MVFQQQQQKNILKGAFFLIIFTTTQVKVLGHQSVKKMKGDKKSLRKKEYLYIGQFLAHFLESANMPNFPFQV